MGPSRRGGVVVRAGGALRFVDVAFARRAAHIGPVTPIEGAPPSLLGLSLVEGEVALVLALQPFEAARLMKRGGPALLCAVEGEPVALVADALVESGVFDAGEQGVHVGTQFARDIDLAAMHRDLGKALKAERSARTHRRGYDSKRSRSLPPASQVSSPLSSSLPPSGPLSSTPPPSKTPSPPTVEPNDDT